MGSPNSNACASVSRGKVFLLLAPFYFVPYAERSLFALQCLYSSCRQQQTVHFMQSLSCIALCALCLEGQHSSFACSFQRRLCHLCTRQMYMPNGFRVEGFCTKHIYMATRLRLHNTCLPSKLWICLQTTCSIFPT